MDLTNIITLSVGLAGAAVGIGSLVRAVIEYRKQGVTKRSELFLKMRSRLREDPSFKNICSLLERDDKELMKVPLYEKDRFLGFFEELALVNNSGLINEKVALYMFGYYAIRCLKSRNFWYGLDPNHQLWALFKDFATQMEKAERDFQYDRKDFHL